MAEIDLFTAFAKKLLQNLIIQLMTKFIWSIKLWD